MSDFTFKIEGLAELTNRLDAMGNEMAAKALVGSAYSATKVIVESARSNLESNGSVDTGLLRDSITRKKLIYDKDGRVVIITGVSKSVKGTDSKGRPRVPWRYAHLVEAKQPFLVPAFDATKQQVLDEMIVMLLKKIKKFERTSKA
jgi:HK97 gp10 family phage protein